MHVKFGNLPRPRHSNNPDKPEAEKMVLEMMDKLHAAGFERQQNISNGVNDGKFYHVFDLPYQMEFGGNVQEAIAIMTPYSDYMQPIAVTGPDDTGTNS